MSDDKLNELLLKCWRDADTRKRFIANPETMLTEYGIELPPDIELVVVEDTATKVHVVLPPPAAAKPAELSDAQLDAVSGGAGTAQPSPSAQPVVSPTIAKLRAASILTATNYTTCQTCMPAAPGCVLL